MPFIDQANIACGGHAGDADTVHETVELAKRFNVRVGAHPSYVDKEHFGRRSLSLPLAELEQQLLKQVSLLADSCQQLNYPLSHIKAHGALYNDSNDRPEVMELLLHLAKAFQCELMLQSLPDMQQSLSKAKELGVPLVLEGFADRAYLSSGRLAPRGMDGAVFDDVKTITMQAMRLANGKAIYCLDDDASLLIQIDSLCVHGDNELALQALTQLYDALH